jgi:hypothetical protein
MKARGYFFLPVILVACATTGAEGEGDKNLPTAGVGPFRKLDPDEVKGLAPYVFDDSTAIYRDPAVIAEGRETVLFAIAKVKAATGTKDAIVRTHASDGRSFFGTSSHLGKKPTVILEPDKLWEGNALSGPAVVRFAGDVLLYYAGAEGIGAARAATPTGQFRKEPGPVLGRDASPGSWESTVPSAPTVFLQPDGKTLRMFYAAGNSIGEAESTDGIAWRRLRPAPVLNPAAPAPPGSLLPNEKPPFDTASVGDPCAVTRITPSGRFHVRVLYTGTDPAGASAIGFAARFGTDGPLERQRIPVYSVNLHERAPALLDLGPASFLYVQQDRRDNNNIFTAIAAAYSPGNAKLPPADDFPAEP